jgi:hypothetical protein
MLWSFESIFGVLCIGIAFVHTSFFHIDLKINSSTRWEWNMKLEVIQHLFNNEGLFWILEKNDGLTLHQQHP